MSVVNCTMKLEVTIVPSVSFGVFLCQSFAGVEVDTSGTLDLKRALKPLSMRASGMPSHGTGLVCKSSGGQLYSS